MGDNIVMPSSLRVGDVIEWTYLGHFTWTARVKSVCSAGASVESLDDLSIQWLSDMHYPERDIRIVPERDIRIVSRAGDAAPAPILPSSLRVGDVVEWGPPEFRRGGTVDTVDSTNCVIETPAVRLSLRDSDASGYDIHMIKPASTAPAETPPSPVLPSSLVVGERVEWTAYGVRRDGVVTRNDGGTVYLQPDSMFCYSYSDIDRMNVRRISPPAPASTPAKRDADPPATPELSVAELLRERKRMIASLAAHGVKLGEGETPADALDRVLEKPAAHDGIQFCRRPASSR
jgi:hypothetical protein